MDIFLKILFSQKYTTLVGMASNDIGDWFRNIPQITKIWFAGSIIVPLIGRFGLVNPMNLVLDYSSVVHHFQVLFS